MTRATRRWEWLVAGAPVVFALLIHGFTHGSLLMSLPLAAFVVFATGRDIRVERQPWKLLVTAAFGTALGFIVFMADPMPPGAIPPVILAPLSAALACLCCYVHVSRQPMYAWLYAWLLAVLSLNVPPQGVVLALFFLLVVSTLACGLTFGGVLRSTWIGFVAFVAFVVSVALIGHQLVRLALGSEDALLSAASRLLTDWEAPGGVGLQSEIMIGTRSRVGPSNRALLEIEGAAPGYLRTHLMEKFDGSLWTASESARGRAVRGASDQEPAYRTQRVLLIDRLEDVIPAPAGTMSIEGVSARPERGWLWRSLSPPNRELTLHRTALERLPVEGAPAEANVQLPGAMADDFRPLAMEIVGDAKTPRQMAERIERFFETKFEYSLETDLRGGGHPLAVLIREKRPAYCIYFASAMAVLLRSVGVSARLVGGFAPSEVNPFTKRTIVRVRDAHAWVEVYLPEESRWVAFDPTPSQSREAVIDGQRLKWISMLWDATVSFLRRQWMSFKEDPVEYVVAQLTSVPGLIVIALIIGWQVQKRWKGIIFRARAVTLESNDPDLRKAYRQYKGILRRMRIEPAVGETDDELIARVRQAAGVSGAEAAGQFVEAYRRARYASGGKERLGESLRQLEETLKRAG